MPRKQPTKTAAPPPEPEEPTTFSEQTDAPEPESSGADEFTEKGQDQANAKAAEDTPKRRANRRRAKAQADDAAAEASGEGDDPADDAPSNDPQDEHQRDMAEQEREATENAEPPASEEAVTSIDAAKGSGTKTRATRRKKPESGGGDEAEPDAEKRSAPAPALAETAGLDDADDYLKLLWYGVGGTGKTTDFCTILNLEGEKGRLLVINAEAGLKARALREHGIDTSRIQIWPDPKSGERITYDGLVSVYNRLEKDLREDPDSWIGVAMDSSTEVLQLLLDNIRQKLYEEQQEKLARSTSGRIGALRGRFETETDDYTEVNNMLRQVLRDIRYLPCHFFLTALERSDENKEARRTVYGPAVSPSFQGSLIGYVDIAIRTGVFVGEDGVEAFTGRTRPTQYENAKERYGVLPVNMINPSALRIAQYILGQLDEDSDPEITANAEKALSEVERRATTGRQKPVRRGRKDKDADEASEETEPAKAAG